MKRRGFIQALVALLSTPAAVKAAPLSRADIPWTPCKPPLEINLRALHDEVYLVEKIPFDPKDYRFRRTTIQFQDAAEDYGMARIEDWYSNDLVHWVSPVTGDVLIRPQWGSSFG